MISDFLAENDSWYLFLFRLLLAVTITYNFSEGGVSGFFVPGQLQYSLLILLHPYLLKLFDVDLTSRQILWVAVGVFLHPLGMVYGLYPAGIHWDYFTHLYSGMLVSALVMSVIWSFGWKGRKAALTGFTTVLVLGLGWELFEIYFADHLTFYGNWDAVKDLTNNSIAWALIYLFGRERLSNVVDGFRGFREKKGFF